MSARVFVDLDPATHRLPQELPKDPLVIMPYPPTKKPCCPKCSGDHLAFSIGEDEEVLCPKCERGYPKVCKRWIT
jgi:hypothetical protein